MNCPKCNGEMDKGIQVDHGLMSAARSIWMQDEGLPKHGLGIGGGGPWFGPPGVKRYVLEAHRCKDCGFVETYALQRAY